MLQTCKGVTHMSTMIQIRHVPDDIHKTLKIRAIEKGMSLSDYLLREITEIVKRPTLEEVMQRVESRYTSTISEDSGDALRAERESR